MKRLLNKNIGNKFRSCDTIEDTILAPNKKMSICITTLYWKDSITDADLFARKIKIILFLYSMRFS